MNFGLFVEAITLLFRFVYYAKEGVADCYNEQFHEVWLGSALAWLAIEILVFAMFLFTLLLALLKMFCNYSVTAD